MVSVKVTFSNGNYILTDINTTIEGARQYYLGKWFNLGINKDDMQKAIKVEELKEIKE